MVTLGTSTLSCHIVPELKHNHPFGLLAISRFDVHEDHPSEWKWCRPDYFEHSPPWNTFESRQANHNKPGIPSIRSEVHKTFFCWSNMAKQLITSKTLSRELFEFRRSSHDKRASAARQLRGFFPPADTSKAQQNSRKIKQNLCFFPRASERRLLLMVGVCYTFHIFTSSHLRISS